MTLIEDQSTVWIFSHDKIWLTVENDKLIGGNFGDRYLKV